MPIVANLYRYPLKGLSAESLPSAELVVGQGLPQDRAYALALTTAASASPSSWHPKSNFATLVRHERLAALDARYDPSARVLTIRRGGKTVTRGALDTPMGRAMVEEFFRAYLKGSVTSPPRIVGGGDAMLWDRPEPALSIVGLASIADIERVIGAEVDPLRFRANVYLTGTAPWEEFDWVGREIALGGALLEVTARLGRCAAIDVDPRSGVRDLAIPRSLRAAFGHADCGVLASVTAAGLVDVGDSAGPVAA